MRIISIANQKGGVGKTTTAMSLAAGLVQKGKKVLCIDFDPQGNLSDYLGYEPSGGADISSLLLSSAQQRAIDIKAAILRSAEGIDYIPSGITLASADMFLAQTMCREKTLWQILQTPALEIYDFIIIDCLPSLGILLTNALAVSTEVIIPVQAQKFSLDGVAQLMQAIGLVQRSLNPALTVSGILLTMYDGTNMSKAVRAALAASYGKLVFTTDIRRSVEATESSYNRRSLLADTRSRLGQEYQQVVAELLEREE